MFDKFLKVAPYILLFFVVYETVAIIAFSPDIVSMCIHAFIVAFNGYILKYIEEE